jgi:N-hydroxyarylamine O-acetyltransferase
MMELSTYFARIGYRGVPRPDLPTLRRLLRAHVLAVPFENLDVQLGQPIGTDPDAAYRKIVLRRRGGWCYEQNGLFGWALSTIGFDVTRVAAAVMRAERGDVSEANHLALLVRMPDSDDTWLADVGFGGSLLDPIRLQEAEYRHEPFKLGLRILEDGHWQFWEDAGDGEFRYDFRAQPASEDALSGRCAFLQSDPDSSFVLNLVAQVRTPEAHTTLRGRLLRRRDSAGETTTTLGSPDQLLQVLANTFGLDVPAIVECWPKILARHEQRFGD